MKLYVAGPMTRLPEMNFPAFAEAAQALRAIGYDVRTPHEVTLPCGCAAPPPRCGADDHPYLDFLRTDLLAMLSHAQGVALLPGWERSRGATVERHLAEALEMKVHPVEYWLARPVEAVA